MDRHPPETSGRQTPPSPAFIDFKSANPHRQTANSPESPPRALHFAPHSKGYGLTMATLRLFDPSPAHPDGSHHMAAPGGYESWRFYAHDPSQNLRLVFGFHHGYCLHPDYVRRFTTYRLRPTRHAPPVPAFYPCWTVSIYEGLQPLASSTIQYPAGS